MDGESEMTNPAIRFPRKFGFPRPRKASRAFQALTGLATLIVVVAAAWALFPSVWATHDPFFAVPSERFQPPSMDHWFGTDNIGRDLYSRVVYGTALTMQGASLAVIVAFTLGSGIGLISGYMGGRVDGAAMRLVDVFLAVPGILLAMAIVTAIGFGTLSVAIAIGLVGMTTFARVMRAEVLRVTSYEYVEAARASGARPARVLVRHILPNALGPVLALAALDFGTAVLLVSALSFLGFGAAAPAPEWGNLVSEGRHFLTTAEWMTMFPGLMIMLLVLAVNFLARGLGQEKVATE